MEKPAHVEQSQESPPVADLVERLIAENLISMKEAAKLYGPKGHKSTPTRHHLRGVKLNDGTTCRLEAIRVGGKLLTSRAAVLRFFAAQNQAPASPPPAGPTPTPRQQRRAAEGASKKVAAAVGSKR
jgi:hypothetical protein